MKKKPNKKKKVESKAIDFQTYRTNDKMFGVTSRE